MLHIRTCLIALLCSCSLTAMSQSHDFEIRDFHENATDLTAATAKIKDLNGMPAALIRFAVRDTLFVFDANNGIIKRKNSIGEVLLFVPPTTRRLTISHPFLGIIRDYQLPLNIRSKTTYDAEIVITNADYMRKLMGYEQQPPEVAVVPVPEPEPVSELEQQQQEVPEVFYDDEPQQAVVQPKKSHTPIGVRFLGGAGFHAVNFMGPNVSLGLQVGRIVLSADYTIGVNKVEGVGIYNWLSTTGNGLVEAYDYSASRFSVWLGFNTSLNSTVQAVPQVGVSFNMIKGDLVANHAGDNAQFADSNPMSLSIALNMRIRLAAPLYLTLTPQYDFAIGADDVYKVIKNADSKIEGWAEGFGVNAGLMLIF